MNFVSSHGKHENCRYERFPSQGPSRGTAEQFRIFREWLRSLTRHGGTPFWGDGIHRTFLRSEKSSGHFVQCNVHGKSSGNFCYSEGQANVPRHLASQKWNRDAIPVTPAGEK